MSTQVALVLALLLGLGCSEEPPAPADRDAPAAARSENQPGLVADPGSSASEPTRAEAAFPGEAVARARDSTPLHGRWRVRRLESTVNGAAAPPQVPPQPTTWAFSADGVLRIEGSESQTSRYLYTGDRLFVRGSGPLLEFRVVALTGRELRLVSVAELNGVRVERAYFADRELR